jgi:hypothetical protein
VENNKKIGTVPYCSVQCCGSEHRFDADPDSDPTFNVDADPDPTQNFYACWKIRTFEKLLFTAVPVYIILSSCQRHRCYNFQHLDSVSKFLEKVVQMSFTLG